MNIRRLLFLFFVFIAIIIYGVDGDEQRRLRVAEDASVGTVIGRIRDDDSKENTDGPIYMIVHTPESQTEQTFSVDDRTGEIKTKTTLDYETKTSYVFLAIPIVEKAGGNGGGIRVTIEILDVNDCAPVFSPKRIDVPLSEYAKIGTETPLPSADDRDGSEKFGVQKYEIISGNVNNAFRLGVRRLNRLLYVDLIVNSELDREFLDRYSLEIRASDGGEPKPLTDTLLVNVTILDANDNQPIFEHPRYVVPVSSNVTVNALITTLRATDKDVGENAAIDYRLLPSPMDAHKYFRIDSTSGQVFLVEPLGVHRQYELLAAARDRGSPEPLEATTFVTINVLDADEHKPEIKIIYMSEDGRSTVSEAAEIGSLVARVSVNDPDTHREFGRVNVSVDGGENGSGCFGVQQSSEIVYILLKKHLDRETDAVCPLTISANVDGTIFRRSETVRVMDVNDNAPRFAPSSYEAEVKEKSTPGTSVIRVEAIDKDDGENGRVTYTLTPSAQRYANWFDIDPETGLITTADSIDCEISSRPEFTVLATDNGRPPLSSTVKLSITVLDANDNPPRFGKSLYNVTLPENTDVGYCFEQTHATDTDCGVNAQIRYKLVANAIDSSMFTVDESTGNLCLASKLDYETRRHHQFTVEAHDGGGLYGSTNVLLIVQDVNDNAPVFYPIVYNVTLRRNTWSGTPVLIVAANDPDDDYFGLIKYEIAPSNEANKFRVDPNTGELYVTQQLSTGVFQLAIQATDGGGLVSQHPAIVTVMVPNDDRPSLLFDQRIYKFTVREDTPPGIAAGTVRVVSPTSGVTFSIYAGDPHENFTIDFQTGAVTISRYLNHETRQKVLLNVQASSSDPPAFNHTQVEILVEDVNDNAPFFEQTFVRTAVPEDQPLHTAIFVCTATDKDSGKNGEIRYRLIANPGNIFMVHPVSGEIRLAKPLDYEKRQNYTLGVSAQDGGIPMLSTNMTLQIDVVDVNDHEPRFAQNDYRITVPENVAATSRLLQMRATDDDSGVNGQIIYKLESNDSPFRIFADSGWVYVRQLLDRETKNEYVLKVIARDNGQPSKSTSASLTIIVGDVNDNAPNCSQIQKLSISENRPAGTLIGRLRAEDPDEGENGTVSFSFPPSKSHPLFRLSPDGDLYSETVLDRETTRVYDLSVVASDKGSPSLSSTCTVRIDVLDENDQAPFFVLPTRDRLYFREEQQAGAEVTQVRANDPDENENGTVRYKLEFSTAENVAAPFKIDEKTGVISATVRLDFEKDAKEYEFFVVAEDEGKPPRSSRRKFVVVLVDVDDGGRSTNETVQFEVSENLPVGYRLGAVDTHRKINKNDIDNEISVDKMEFFFTHAYEIVAGNSMSVFDVDRATSELYLIRRLDYETSSVHYLIVNKIAQTPSIYPPATSEIHVKIIVSDENDNSPTFADDPIIFSVPENKAGLVVWQYNATDNDTGSFGRVEYRIVEQYPEIEKGLFRLDPVSGELFLEKELDFERVTEYLLVVEATDQAPNVSQRNAGRVTTRIYVTDVNDCEPKFVSRDYAYVFDDKPVDHPIIYVAAVDDDWLENGRVTYRIASGNERNQFTLNASSGALLLTRRLDRESAMREYRLTVVAEDHGVPSRSSTQILTLRVLDVDHYAPRFEQAVYHANVTENGVAGHVVAQLRATAHDKGNGKDLLYILPAGTAGDKFRLDEKTGTLSTTGSLDREETEQYVMTVYVRDASNFARYDASTIIVNVEDLNDNAPIIGEATCLDQSVPENQPFAYLHKIIGYDADAETNARLTYTIVAGNVDGKFRINPTSGELSCDALDRESVPVYNLTVQVHDNGSPSLSTQCNLPIYVFDVNDNSPRFDKPSYSTQVTENALSGTTVLRVQANDTDDGLNGKVMYTMVNDTAGLFDIGANSGEIVVIGNLDFEQGNAYSFFVKATDQSPSESRYELTRVTVQIMDSNDNAPTFLELPFIANVSAEIAAGQRIVKVTATDADGPGPNSEISYSLVNQEDPRFTINPTTGVVSAKQHLRLAPTFVEYLPIVATDQGNPPKSSTGIVEIVVDSALDAYRRNGLKFSKPVYEAQVSEDANVGTFVTDVQVSQTENRRIGYKIISGNENGPFKIDEQKGTIVVADTTRLDYETTRFFQLIVEARVIGEKNDSVAIQKSYVSVKIEITDGNDHAPKFLQQLYSATVSEGKPRGTFVIHVSATDGDVGENAALTYSIVAGNVDSAFAVDNGGVVTTNAELDREIHDRYNLTVMAVDAGSSPKSGRAIVDVLVMDINDNSPSFPMMKPIPISESAPVGTLLTTVTANDVDTFPPLVYVLSEKGNGSNYFNLDRFSGRLVLAQRLDYERTTELNLEIQVSDGIHVATAHQKIIIQDENDNTPRFSQPFYQFVVLNNTSGGSNVGHVSATDDDSGENGLVRYRLVGSVPQNVGFVINSDDGTIFLNRSSNVNTDLPPFIQLTVSAYDGGKPPRSAFTTVHIQLLGNLIVEEHNDFASPSYSFPVSEDAPIHSIIGTLSTTTTGRAENNSSKHLRFTIKSGDRNRTFDIDSDGNVILMKQLDRETVDVFHLDVSLQSKANSISNSTARLTINVEDINDNWPTFDEKEYEVPLQENIPPGAVVFKLNAKDKDAGANGTVTYELTSGNSVNYVAVDSQTGTVSLRRPLLRTTFHELRCVVRASDGGTPSRSTLVTLLLRIDRGNVSAPFFPMKRYVQQIFENAPAGSFVLRVNGAETEGVRSDLTYSISAGNEEKKFEISPTTGELRTTKPLDYEEKTSYRLTLTVRDSAGRPGNSSAQIFVGNVDEYAPIFEQNGFTLRASYDAKIDYVLGALRATDADAGPDGRITFIFKEHTPYFRIDPKTGAVFVAASLAELEERKVENSQTQKIDSEKSAEPKTKSIFLTVVAYSGPNEINGKANSTILEIQLGRFSTSGKREGVISAGAIVSISVGLILLVVFILVLVAVKLRRRVDKPKLSLSSSTMTRNLGRKVSKNSSGRGRKLKPADIIQPSAKAASRAATSASFAVANLRMQPIPNLSTTDGRHAPSKPVSQRESVCEETKVASRTSSRLQNARSAPDSGIHLFPDDTVSVNSDHLPSTQEYLTSLGVDTSASTLRRAPRQQRRDFYDPTSASPDGEVWRKASNLENMKNGFAMDDDLAQGDDVQELIYSKVNEVLAGDEEGPNDIRSARGHISTAAPPRIPAVDSLYGEGPSDGVSALRTSWPAPVTNWGPSYQPLTQVFSEIAKIKNDQDTLKRRAAASDASANSNSVYGRAQPGRLCLNANGRSNAARSPNGWAPTNFASPDDCDGFYGVSNVLGHARPTVINGDPTNGRGEAELEIKI